MIELFDLRSSSTKLTDFEFDKFYKFVDDKHVDVNVRDRDGLNSLLWLCQNYDHDNLFDLIRLLSDKGADVTATTPDGWTVLH